MAVKFKESNRDNPLRYFEDFFTKSGQLRAKIHFLAQTLPQVMDVHDPEDGSLMDYSKYKCDLENTVFAHDLSDYDDETGEYYQNHLEFRYIDHLRSVLVNPESIKFADLLKQRIDGCDSPEQEAFVLGKMLLKVEEMKSFLDENQEVPYKDRLKAFLEKLKEQISKFNRIVPEIKENQLSDHKLGIEQSKNKREAIRLTSLNSHIPLTELMLFLKDEGFIRCIKAELEVAKVNYYFGIGKSTKKPSTKIKWLKDPELLKLLTKKAFNGGPKYELISKIFEVENVSEEEIINWTNRNINKILDKISEKKLIKFLNTKKADNIRNSAELKLNNEALMD